MTEHFFAFYEQKTVLIIICQIQISLLKKLLQDLEIPERDIETYFPEFLEKGVKLARLSDEELKSIKVCNIIHQNWKRVFENVSNFINPIYGCFITDQENLGVGRIIANCKFIICSYRSNVLNSLLELEISNEICGCMMRIFSFVVSVDLFKKISSSTNLIFEESIA